MKTAVITGSNGLIGFEAALYFAEKGFQVIGIDNDMRSYFFGKEASTIQNREALTQEVKNYIHKDIDIRSIDDLKVIFKEYNTDIKLIIHTAAQPSHDWAAREPLTDFGPPGNR